MFRMGNAMLLVLLAALVGCTHPLDAEGEGDIRSLSGTRDCTQGEYPCNILVVHDYGELYAAVPAPGYAFVGWRNCSDQFPWCVFNVPASTVHKFWGKTVAPLVAVFRSINLMLKNPPEGGVLSKSGRHDCPAGQTCAVRGRDTKGFGQVFTANPGEGYRFDGWRRRNGDYFCPGSTYPCEIEDSQASAIAQSAVNDAGLRGRINLEDDRELELVPTFQPLAPGSLVGRGDRRVNSSIPSSQHSGDIAALTGGGYVVVWLSSHYPSGRPVLAQLYSDSGDAIGQEIRVSGIQDSSKSSLQVTALASNRFLVTWHSSISDQEVSNVVARVFDANGEAVTAELTLSASEYRTEFARPSSAARPDGGFVITWAKVSWGSSEGIYGQHFDDAGQPLGEPAPISEEGHDVAGVAFFGDGASVIATSDWEYGQGNTGINLQCISADGQLIQEGTPGNYEQILESVKVLNSDAFVVTWFTFNRDHVPPIGISHSGVYARVFARDCTPLSTEIQVNTYVYGNQYDSRVVAMRDGGFAIGWTSESHTLDSSFGVFIQRFNALGEKIGGEQRVNTYTPEYQSGIKLAAIGNEVIAAVWNSNTQNASNAGVFGKHLSIDSDGDLIPDDWEREYDLDPAFPYDALLDPDNDGKHNLDEFLTGGNPLVDEG